MNILEVHKYAKSCTDPDVIGIIRLLNIARSKNALWCDALAKSEQELEKTRKQYQTLLEAATNVIEWMGSDSLGNQLISEAPLMKTLESLVKP
jgi:hypothetical protein